MPILGILSRLHQFVIRQATPPTNALAGTTRASFSVYNTTDEIDRLVKGLHRVKTMMA